MMKRTEMLKEHIEGNIEILDYLQGISGLERDFSVSYVYRLLFCD
ncbi:unnamed protein product [Schistosoma curassoni]|uniref:Transcriptional regulator n=1 Tax=Schistosoma curassoni TaxID=6186 RepID=A0A183JEQ5_9TREM|nr:unnamed protein product [Schistosoma curassoni]